MKLKFIDAIWLYGSRSRGDNQERSDIDLIIVCPRASEVEWLEILKIVDEKDTLLQVDVIRFEDVNDLQFKKRIEKEKIILYKK